MANCRSCDPALCGLALQSSPGKGAPDHTKEGGLGQSCLNICSLWYKQVLSCEDFSNAYQCLLSHVLYSSCVWRWKRGFTGLQLFPTGTSVLLLWEQQNLCCMKTAYLLPSITCGKCEGSLSLAPVWFLQLVFVWGSYCSVFVFKLKCMTAGTEEAEVKTQHVVVNCKHIRLQVCLQWPVSNTCIHRFSAVVVSGEVM